MASKSKDQYFSISALFKSFSYAAQGIWFCLTTQRNAFVHIIAALAVCVSGVYFKININDWRWLCVCILLVWFAELINTSFEYLCDLIHPDFSLSVKRAKDIAAGAVLVCSLGAIVIGLMTFWPYL